MDSTLAVALVGGLLGGAFAAGLGGLITLTVQRREHTDRRKEADAGRDHELRLARDARLQDRRARAYQQMLEYLYRLDLWVERTEPMIGPKPDPPESAADDELIRLNAITAAHASPKVRAAVLGASDLARLFTVAVWRLHDEMAKGYVTPDMPPARVEVHEHRRAFHQSVRDIGELINGELAG